MMNKYSEIEIQTAKVMLENQFKWIARNESGKLFVHSAKPNKGSRIWWSDGYISQVCSEFVPIFQNIKFGDSEPVSLEAIVHPPILDDAERKYLSAVIKPFRKSVISIAKSTIYGESEAICIDTEKRYMVFPPFEKGTMYKGMKPDHGYSLEELGL